MVKIPPLAKSLFVELIQGFYHPRDKDGLRGWYKKPQKKNWNHLWRRNTCMGGTEKFVGRIKFTNWGCKKKGNLNKVQGGAGLPFEEESRGKAT